MRKINFNKFTLINQYKSLLFVSIQILNMELDKQQYLETFLHIVKGSRTKNDFLRNVQDFDLKFTEAYQRTAFQNKPSYESFQSVQQIEPPQKPKNPFINPNQDNTKRNYSPNRSNNLIQQTPSYYPTSNNYLASNQNKMNIQPSRSEQDFFKPPQPSKTFHAGFGPKDYEKQQFANQKFPSFSNKGPQYAWQTGGQAFGQQPPQFNPHANFQQEMKQNYNEMMNKFASYGMNEPQAAKYMNSNIDLSINSHQNFNPNPNNNGNEILPSNEYLAAFQKDYESFGKFNKPPMPNQRHAEESNPRAFMMERGQNPFANRAN